MTMNDDLDLSRYQVRTDLALESFEMALDQLVGRKKQKVEHKEIEGVIIKEKMIDEVKISLATITPEGAQKFGKKEGNYLTMEMQGIGPKIRSSSKRCRKYLQKKLVIS